jgi:hypothetical protein
MAATTARIAYGLLLFLASGCAPALQGHVGGDLEARCLSTGGRWHSSVAREGFCEYQSPGMI